jgi:antitoxin (DNA-binding transcriptional repressor) of toxin-antitoxin stability system
MRELTIREMRENLGSLDQLVKSEGEIIVTRHGIPIARVLPMRGALQKPAHAELRAKAPRLTTPSQTWIRGDRDER